MGKDFHKELKVLMDTYVHEVYKATRSFPKGEIYGVTSQFRRASLSVILNYIEGYARVGEKSYLNFIKISYGSLKESRYLIHFSLVEGFILKDDFEKLDKIADEIGGMLWGIIKNEKR
jgi:four helix bundle protein